MKTELFASLAERERHFLQQEILEGKYGQPGDHFMTTRALAELRQVSLVTAHHILTGLCAEGYLTLRGKKYILSHAPLLEKAQSQGKILGLLVPQVNNEFYSSLADMVIRLAKRNGYDVLLMSTAYSPQGEAHALQQLLKLAPAGIINCVPTPKENASLYADLAVPCVMLGHSLDDSKISSVQVNSFAICQKIAQHLLEENYKKFLYIGTRNLPLAGDIRYTAFRMELNRHGYPLEPRDVIQVSANRKSDDSLLIQFLEGRTEPTAVFCYHDLIAMQVYRICNSLGKRVPEDVGIVGFDDLAATSRYLSLTTVRYRVFTMAEMAMNLLLNSIKTPNAPYDNYYIEPSLVIRKSSTRSRCESARP